MQNFYNEIKIEVGFSDLFKIENIFYKLGIFQLVIEDPRDLFENNLIYLDAYFERNEIFKNSDFAVVKYYLSDKENLDDFLKTLNQMISYEKIDCKLTIVKVFEEDWADNWKKYYHTFKIGEIVIKPEWETYNLSEGEVLININPGMAFGAGTHETTELCIKFIEKYMKKDFIVYDVGTGSGILAILASKLGAKKVVAIDLDKVSISAAKYNANLNNISNIDVIEGNLLDNAMIKGDLIIANIIAEVIEKLIPDIAKVLDKDGIFIASGIISSKADFIRKEFLKYGFRIIDEFNKNDWFCFAVEIV